MGWNDHIPDLSGEAEAVAIKAKAVVRCELHEDIVIDNGDPDARSYAFAIGTNRWKQGDMGCTREEFIDAIAEAIDQSADECPICAKYRDD